MFACDFVQLLHFDSLCIWLWPPLPKTTDVPILSSAVGNEEYQCCFRREEFRALQIYFFYHSTELPTSSWKMFINVSCARLHLREKAVQGVVHQRRPGAGHGPPGQALAGQRQQRGQRVTPQATVSTLHHQPRQLAHLRHRGRQLPGPRPGAAQAPAHLQLLHHQPRQLPHVRHRERRQGARPGRRRWGSGGGGRLASPRCRTHLSSCHCLCFS